MEKVIHEEAPERADHLQRRDLPAQEVRRRVVDHVRVRAAHRLPGARGAVRELHPPHRDPGHRAARAHGRAARDLWLFNSTINIFSQIGCIMLIGIACKNGILIVEFANQLRDRGVEFVDAIIQSSATRLRPVLMTSLCTAFGAVPLMLAHGAGAESRESIGATVFFGTVVSLGHDAVRGARAVPAHRPQHALAGIHVAAHRQRCSARASAARGTPATARIRPADAFAPDQPVELKTPQRVLT